MTVSRIGPFVFVELDDKDRDDMTQLGLAVRGCKCGHSFIASNSGPVVCYGHGRHATLHYPEATS